MNKFQLALITLATAGTLGLSTIAPASADGAASTRNIVLGAAAIAGIAIESNLAAQRANDERWSEPRYRYSGDADSAPQWNTNDGRGYGDRVSSDRGDDDRGSGGYVDANRGSRDQQHFDGNGNAGGNGRPDSNRQH